MKEIDFELPKDSKPRLPKHLGIAMAGVIVAGVLIFVGAKVNERMQPVRLPANQSCLQANNAAREGLKTFQAQIVAALDGQVADAPDLSAITNAVRDCKAT